MGKLQIIIGLIASYLALVAISLAIKPLKRRRLRKRIAGYSRKTRQRRAARWRKLGYILIDALGLAVLVGLAAVIFAAAAAVFGWY